MSSAPSAEFIDGAYGRLLTITRKASGGSGPCALFVAPLAEEMNKSRRVLASMSNALSRNGWSSVLVDLSGTGDSDGEFGDSTLARWVDDLDRTRRWIADSGGHLGALVGVRFGALLAARFAASRGLELGRTVFLQPVVDGGAHLRQLLRVRAMAATMNGQRESIAELEKRLRDGEALELAGYALNAQLAADLFSLELGSQASAGLGRIGWFEISTQPERGLAPASTNAVAALRARDIAVDTSAVGGDAFWSSTEILDNPPAAEAVAEWCARDG